MDHKAEFDSLVPAQGFDRRSFLVTSLGAGFALATLPVAAQTAIRTDVAGLLEGEVKVPVGDGEMVAYRAAPEGVAKAPVVLLISEIFGVHEYIRDTARRLAKLGYFVIAPELFARQGDPRKIDSIAEIIDKISSKTPDAEVMADLDASVAWAAKQGADTRRLAITGFCWGGRITWLYSAHNPGVKAGVAWYGRLVSPVNQYTPRHPIDLVGELKAPVLGLYGGVDTGIPVETVDAMEVALKKGGSAAQASRLHLYDNAPHAFHADYRPSYRKEEAEDGWRRMLDWFRKNGV
ncbi:dienelactone hydrolase family protein [Azonexus sp.]|uniref:dienelactone hydrolase family protein n=1 Tax=Azonexus sp. TaxID=1872668 RepID=UPI0027B9E60E|nr:dienelactone hydrolase family protein [Azonexus sp.]